MAESFDFINAPQFIDFNKDMDYSRGTFDAYFDQYQDPLNNSDILSEVTLIADDLESLTTSKSKFRKSMSVGDLQKLCDNIHKLRSGKIYINEESNQESTEETFAEVKYVSSNSLCDDTSCSTTSSSNRRTTKEFINRLAQPKRQFKSDQNLNKDEYVPMAEALKKFQNATPKRFRTRVNSSHEPLKCTIPQSPKLQTTVRSRPVHVLSYEEQQRMAAEEAKKTQFKAHPVNKKALQPPTPPVSKGKRSTIPEPFKLTSVAPKKIGESPKKTQPAFHAKPVPRSLYENNVPKINHSLMRTQVTKPCTPSFMKKYNANPIKAIPNMNESILQQPNAKLRATKPLPFSFELRDQHTKSRRDELMRKCIEAEQKAREFHAKPVPKSVLVQSKKFNTSGSSRCSLLMTTKTNSQDNLKTTQFKAKPPTVLYKKPFEPKRSDKPMIEMAEFNLHTDVRAKEREHFEHYIKDKENKLVEIKQREEMMRKQEEEEEIMRARKEAEFKAQEIRRYKELNIIPVKEVTEPVSPKFLTNKLKNNSANKENTMSKAD
ncbi:targeting protein for Xklp2 homolog [Diabrotica virgifera virgifera]|uniref:Targeting protein for Xklp2 homolog n=2 Tax=Diabrotica virgifera virgifera TaxID=50390 RepID=A0ABM5JPZ9_DIAVI|nr:targeting protein for Xklp2 homolog [Diabrotica virgifera virgifera]